MIEVEVTPDMIERSQSRAVSMGCLNNSIEKGAGNLAGFLGEEVANKVLSGTISNTYDYDLVSDVRGRQVKVDVKTKRCTSPPKSYYDCSVAAFNTKQKCDYYAFVRIEYRKQEWGRAWFLGVYKKEDYFKDARFLTKGQVDPSNGFTVKADCYNMEISKLERLP